MNEEEIRSRILICEIKERDYREVGNTKTAKRYNQEKYKWEELLDKIDPKNYEKLKFYKQGYIRLDEENQQLKEQLKQKEDIINEAKELIHKHIREIEKLKLRIYPKEYYELLEILDNKGE